MIDFQAKIDKEVKALICKYETGEIKLIDFAIEVLNYASLESPDICKRVNQILEGQKKPVGRPSTIDENKKVEMVKLSAEKMPQEKIAQKLGVSLSTVRRELKKQPV
jgi:hypothetical protein